ncbi:bifunctional tRNA (adenosine(37)-N6)-threonylcarbamoyltransferase complex ATPase subunit type 1 TsaE/phosphotransferase [Halanaerobium hydrogeniformans]|uniref:tRNA threonylcarbamoyladenosine biosynthesis protein TsaE n=1 Tax=Halanaerobium hydrogeniformans TaxID=656519 RepID=E4RJ55_HALHG|nr:bifunctional tRNA (adenosine(37)-N6)-threonylcarbamoyltransferase complex ATPase subunit type 1 TsaE/phosphotransferase [Halanaerobium hydrogeniformans]ADQ15275.1 Uncharacterized protein family UPF0079, ATPase [Halanaerobium hydrogeniformans]
MGNKEFKFISNSAEESSDFAQKIAAYIEPPVLILLKGELGSGKTLIAQGIASALGYEKEVTSPTFNLVQEYQGALEIIHMDLYRLNKSEELIEIGFEDYLNRDAVILIEWPEIALSLIPADFIFIEINKITSNKREIIISGEGKKTERFVERLFENVNSWD